MPLQDFLRFGQSISHIKKMPRNSKISRPSIKGTQNTQALLCLRGVAERQQKERAVKFRWRNKAGKSRQISQQEREISPFWKTTNV